MTHLSQSLARRGLEPIVVAEIAVGWAHVLQHQRFALNDPEKNCPIIEAEIKNMNIKKTVLTAAARLVLAGADAVGQDLGGLGAHILSIAAEKGA